MYRSVEAVLYCVKRGFDGVIQCMRGCKEWRCMHKNVSAIHMQRRNTENVEQFAKQRGEGHRRIEHGLYLAK